MIGGSGWARIARGNSLARSATSLSEAHLVDAKHHIICGSPQLHLQLVATSFCAAQGSNDVSLRLNDVAYDVRK